MCLESRDVLPEGVFAKMYMHVCVCVRAAHVCVTPIVPILNNSWRSERLQRRREEKEDRIKEK